MVILVFYSAVWCSSLDELKTCGSDDTSIKSHSPSKHNSSDILLLIVSLSPFFTPFLNYVAFSFLCLIPVWPKRVHSEREMHQAHALLSVYTRISFKVYIKNPNKIPIV